MAPSADRLLREALEMPFLGWDFSVLGDRLVVEAPPWSFEQIVDDEAVRAASMPDMGTGGGEWLSNRRHAPRTVATESWPPNVATLVTVDGRSSAYDVERFPIPRLRRG